MSKTANVKSLKDYAAFKGVAYETVRRQVLKYEKELSGHIRIQGRTRYLDDYAMQFLDDKQQVKVVAVFEETGNDILIAELEKNVSDLKDKLSSKDEYIIHLQKIIIEKDAAYIQLQKDYQALTDKQREVVSDPEEQERPEDVQSASGAEKDILPEEEPQLVEELIEEHEGVSEGVPDEIKTVLDSFLTGQISAKEAWELSGLDKKTFSEMYINYKRELNQEVSEELPEEKIGAEEGQTAAVSEETQTENAVSDRSSAPDQEQEKQSQGNKGLLHRLFSFWRH